jgi:hypothetical protein
VHVKSFTMCVRACGHGRLHASFVCSASLPSARMITAVSAVTVAGSKLLAAVALSWTRSKPLALSSRTKESSLETNGRSRTGSSAISALRAYVQRAYSHRSTAQREELSRGSHLQPADRAPLSNTGDRPTMIREHVCAA